MKECQYYIGDSFHGFCFDLIFRKDFICLVAKDIQGLTKFETLLKICDLKNRSVFFDEANEKIETL